MSYDPEVHEKIGRLQGDVEGLSRLITDSRDAILARVTMRGEADDRQFDAHRVRLDDYDRRLRGVEGTQNTHQGHFSASVRWAAAVSGALTLIVNGAIQFLHR